MEGAPGTETIINGKKYLYFAGTGYFQLGSHPEVLGAATKATLNYGICSSTSRIITGTTPLIGEIEKITAEFFKTEDAAYLPSGYLCNIAGMSALNELDLFDVIFIDESSHYSNIEGAMVVGKPLVKFTSRSTGDLLKKIEKHLKPEERPLIASDGLFPIWAKIPPLEDYLEIAEKYNGIIWVDDAHGVGIIGNNGRGTYEYLKLKSNRLFFGATLSKAFGAYGGVIPGKTEFISKIRTGSVMTGCSSPMSAGVAAGIKGLELVKHNPVMREKLWENARYLKDGINFLGIKTDDNYIPIVAFTPGDESEMQKIHAHLMDKGIYIQYAKYRGSGDAGVLRIIVFSTHTKSQIDYLLENLEITLNL